jgi:uncharacterized protein (TIGR00661 family)
MRASALLPHLVKRHEVLVLAGGEAHDTLGPDYSVVRVPIIGFRYNRRAKISKYLTMKYNLPIFLDVRLGGATTSMVCDVFADFRPDLVLSDSEICTHWAAKRTGIPRITVDHFGVLVYGRLEMSWRDHLLCRGEAWVYRRLFGEPDRAIVSAFFDAPPRREGVCVVGPIIRAEAQRIEPSRGPHLLVYFSKGEHEFTPRIEQALLGLDCPVRVYGTRRRGLQGNLQFKPFANLSFLEDLAGARAVFATTGNQLCGEVIHFGKPLLGMPIDCLEQRINAQAIERMGVGMRVTRERVSTELLRCFLSREEEFARNAQRQARDGVAETLEVIERFAGELCGGRSGAGAGV